MADSPPPGSPVHDAALALDGLFLAAVRYGTASAAWQDAALRLLALVPSEGGLTLHIGPGHVLELGAREGALGTQTEAIHEVWRDGVRSVSWRGPCEPAVHLDGMRAMCGPADVCHAGALQGSDRNPLRAWGGASRAHDTVTHMLSALAGRSGFTFVAVDPYADATGAHPDAVRAWVQPPRPDMARVLVDAVNGGVEAPRRVERLPTGVGFDIDWEQVACSVDAETAVRGLELLEAASRVGGASDDALLDAWGPSCDAIHDEQDTRTFWERLGRLLQVASEIAEVRPALSSALRSRLTEAGASARVVARLDAALAVTDFRAAPRDVARWYAWSAPSVREACSVILAARHDAVYARALETALAEVACVERVSLAELYGAHLRAASPVASWAVQRLSEGEPDDPSTVVALRGALQHPDEDVRWLALAALGDDRSEATLAAQERALFAARPDVVARALEEVAGRGDASARSALLHRVQAPDFSTLPPTVRIRFYDALLRLEGDTVAEWAGTVLSERGWFLSGGVKERQSEVRQVLMRLGTPWARGVLARGETS